MEPKDHEDVVHTGSSWRFKERDLEEATAIAWRN